MAQGKRHKPTPETRKLVESLAGYGVPHEQIGYLVGDGITHETLVKHYATDLERGKAKANAKIGQSLFQKAVSGDTAAMIWWTKSQMKWKGADVVEHTGKDGANLVPPTIVVQFPDAADTGDIPAET